MRLIVESLSEDRKPNVYEKEVEAFTVHELFDFMGEFAQEHENNTIIRLYTE